MRTVRLYRVGLFSTFRFGMILGAILQVVPVFLFTALFFGAAGLLADWMEGLRGALPLPGGLSVPVDTITLLGFDLLFQVVKTLASISAVLVIFIGIFLWLVMAMLSGLISVIAAAVFNLISSSMGGIDVEIEESGQ